MPKDFQLVYAAFDEGQAIKLEEILKDSGLLNSSKSLRGFLWNLRINSIKGIRISKHSMMYSFLSCNSEFSYEACILNLLQATPEETDGLISGDEVESYIHKSVRESNFVFGLQNHETVVYDYGYPDRHSLLAQAGIFFPNVP